MNVETNHKNFIKFTKIFNLIKGFTQTTQSNKIQPNQTPVNQTEPNPTNPTQPQVY